MYSEGSTNTRTLEGTLHETISRLTECKQTSEVARLVHQARRYVLILSSWEGAPPPPDEQNDVIDEVMNLLKTSMTIPLERIDTPAQPMPAKKPAAEKPTARKPTAKKPAAKKPAADESPDISIAESEPPPSSRPGTKPLARVPVKRTQQRTRPEGSMGPTTAAGKRASEPFAAGPGTTVLRPNRQPWQAVPGRMGVFIKPLHDEPARSPCRAMVRLEMGAQLPSHRHGVAEDLFVLAGSVQIGSDEAHAGEIIHAEPGATSGLIRSPGECTLLLVGSDRPELLPKGR